MILTLFSFYIQFSKHKEFAQYLNIIAPTIIVVIGALRYEVGADWFAYESLFHTINSLENVWNAREEKLFVLLIYMVKSLCSNYSLFVFVFFFLAFSFKFQVIKKFSPDVYLSLIVYIYTLFLIYDVNGIRQGMAVGFIFMSLPFIINRNIKFFLLMMMGAMLFHKSALIFLPFYWLSRIEISIKHIFYFSLLAIFISIPVRNFIENNTYVKLFLSLDSFSHYSTYIENKHTGRDISIVSVAVFQRYLIFTLFYFNYKKIAVEENFKRLLYNGYFISIMIFLFLSFSAEFAARLGFYYKALEIFIIPMLVFSQRRHLNRLVLLIIFIAFCVLGVYRLLSIPNGGLIPYKILLW